MYLICYRKQNTLENMLASQQHAEHSFEAKNPMVRTD